MYKASQQTIDGKGHTKVCFYFLLVKKILVKLTIQIYISQTYLIQIKINDKIYIHDTILSTNIYISQAILLQFILK